MTGNTMPGDQRAIYRTEYDPTATDGLVSAITDAVASVSESSPTELEPLYDSIDVDALSALFAPTVSGEERRGQVTFPYGDYQITVVADGEQTVEVLVADPDGGV